MADVNVGPILQAMLTRYGLAELGTWLSQRITAGASPEQIELELYDRPEFKLAYPEIEGRRQRKGSGIVLAPLSVDDVLNYRTQARALMKSYGLPPSFYSQSSDFYELIVEDVSIDELNWRLENVSRRAVMAPPEVKAAYGELFGLNADQALFETFVDPTRAQPHLEEMLQQAEFIGAGARFGFDLGAAEAERGASYDFAYADAIKGFGLLDAQRSLFDETLGEDYEDLTIEEEGLDAAFGIGAGAAAKVARRGESRVAATQGRSGGGSDERGPTSLGGAGRR